MATKATTNFNLTAEHGKYKRQISQGQLTVTLDTQGAQDGIVEVGDAEEDMPVGDVATNGLLYLRNLDESREIIYGPKNGSGNMEEFGRLKPAGTGEDDWAWLRLQRGVTLRWQAVSPPGGTAAAGESSSSSSSGGTGAKVAMLLLND